MENLEMFLEKYGELGEELLFYHNNDLETANEQMSNIYRRYDSEDEFINDIKTELWKSGYSNEYIENSIEKFIDENFYKIIVFGDELNVFSKRRLYPKSLA